MNVINPIGQHVNIGGRRGEIIGIVKDMHFQSLHESVEPIVFLQLKDYDNILMNLYGVVMIKIENQHSKEVIAHIKSVWKNVNPEVPFEYYLLDDEIDRQYGTEIRINKIANFFTVLALVICYLGLFGLVSYSTEQRAKEIGIRRVFGASIITIQKLITWSYLKLIFISTVIAVPIGYYLSKSWLSKFAYHVEINVWLFGITILSMLVVAFLVVAFQIFQAARNNPVHVLRNE